MASTRQFVMGVVGLSLDEQNHLKQLLNRGAIVPLAVIDSTVDDLREQNHFAYSTSNRLLSLLVY